MYTLGVTSHLQIVHVHVGTNSAVCMYAMCVCNEHIHVCII